jgi:hypothetical protein
VERLTSIFAPEVFHKVGRDRPNNASCSSSLWRKYEKILVKIRQDIGENTTQLSQNIFDNHNLNN